LLFELLIYFGLNIDHLEFYWLGGLMNFHAGISLANFLSANDFELVFNSV